MHPNEYQSLALTKEADQEKIRQRIYAVGIQATRAENGLRGLTNEVGELAELLKAWLEYGREPPGSTFVLEECGDVLWRTCQILMAFGLTLEDAMTANLRKLNVRYVAQCTDEEAQNRNLEAERKALES